jgi:hypothetical protein
LKRREWRDKMEEFFIDHEKFFNFILQVITAIGTLMAVIISLWIAFRNEKPRLKLEAVVVNFYNKNILSYRALKLEVTKHGSVNTTLTCLFFSTRLARIHFQLLNSDIEIPQEYFNEIKAGVMPYVFTDAEHTVSFYLAFDSFVDDNIREMIQYVNERYPRLPNFLIWMIFRYMRIYVLTSHGLKFSYPLRKVYKVEVKTITEVIQKKVSNDCVTNIDTETNDHIINNHTQRRGVMREHSIPKIYLSIVPIISGIIMLAVWVLWLSYPTQDYQNAFDRYGSFISGSLGVILGTANIIVLIMIWNQQSHLSAIQNTEQMFFHLLSVRIELLNNVKYKPKEGSDLLILKGQEAIIQMANDIKEMGGNNIIKDMTRYYLHQSEHLRHYFDFILDFFEFIDQQNHLTYEQKSRLIKLAVDAFSYDESLVFKLVEFDYDSPRINKKTGKELPTQSARLKALDNKYDVLYRLVYNDPISSSSNSQLPI